jgi:membrane fusion protein (multidrug efflux system)
MRIFLSLLIASLLFFSISCTKKKKVSAKQLSAEKAPPLRVDAYVVKAEMYQDNLEVPGNIVANETTEIHPEVSGRIVSLNITEGRQVGKGAVLAKLYDGDLRAQLNKLNVQLELAKKTEERQSQLLKIQGISQQDYDISLLNVNNLRADIGILETSIAKTVVRAPFSGKIGLNKVSPGAYVSPASVIATISQTDQLKLDFAIPEKYISDIKIGQMVNFEVEGAKKEFGARVVATESNVMENTRSLTIRAAIIGSDPALLAGSFAKVKLSFDPDPNAILIPTQAILPQARGKKVILYRSGKAVFADVVTANRDSARVQIVDGLHAGDTVVVSGLLSVRPESAITIGKIINGKQGEKKGKVPQMGKASE